MTWLMRHFEVDRFGSSLGREVLAGTTTFVALAYIVPVNPAILSQAGMPFDAVLFATVICSSIACILMGLWANKPFALAPGMGMNSYVAYYGVKTLGVPWPTALGIVFVSGVLNVILSLSSVRDRIIDSIPLSLKNAIAVGVGIFIALIGFRTAGILEYDGMTLKGFGQASSSEIALVGVGVALMIFLHRRRVSGGILIGMASIAVLAVLLRMVTPPPTLAAWPHGLFDAFGRLDVIGALQPRYWNLIIALFIIDFFSSVATFIGVSINTNLLDERGRLPKMREALVADSLATPLGAVVGTTSITTYIETASGVQAGGRTGITAIVVAAWLLPMLFFSPLLKFIPTYATAPALIFVGILMMAPLKALRTYKLSDVLGFFVLVVTTSATFSIDQGMLYGFGTYLVSKCVTRQWSETSGFLWFTTGILLASRFT